MTLVDDTSAVIDTVSYDDISPWPTSPDGGGHSLELRDPGLDNNLATSWSSSLANNGTPLAQNSIFGLTLPSVTSVNDPNDIVASQDVDITATVTGTSLSSVVLKYKINFDADITLTMYDDGNHNDGSAGDNVYGATIPGQAVKTLVRFRVEATDSIGTESSPSINDSMDYNGYYVKDPSVVYQSPVIELFVSDADYNDMMTNHVYDNVYVPAVVAYGNDVYDNSKVRIRGASREYAKEPLKVKLPSGYLMDMAGGSNIAIDEFELLNHWWSNSSLLPALNWMTEQTGLPTADMIPTVVEKNGDFHGFFMYANKYQKEWRTAKGYDNGPFYENSGEIISGTSTFTPIEYHYANAKSITDISTQVQKDYILDSYDIPKTITFMAAIGLVQGSDHVSYNNTLQYFDNDTQRWSGLLWDQGATFAGRFEVSPYNFRSSTLIECPNYCPIYNQPELRELYLRRFRTLLDNLYASDQLLNKFSEIEALYSEDLAMDVAKWAPLDQMNGRGLTISELRSLIYTAKQLYLSGLAGMPWSIPPSQTDPERQQVSISEVHADADNAQEYIKLSNSATTPVDISDWYIEGIDYTIPAGSVVPAGGSIYILRSDAAYRAVHSPVLVAGQYPNDLNSFGTLNLKTDTGTQISTYDY